VACSLTTCVARHPLSVLLLADNTPPFVLWSDFTGLIAMQGAKRCTSSLTSCHSVCVCVYALCVGVPSKCHWAIQ
jgi:hypothetical protein